MIIDYDRREDATIDQKMQSLIDSIMRALNEKANQSDFDKKTAELEGEIKRITSQ